MNANVATQVTTRRSVVLFLDDECKRAYYEFGHNLPLPKENPPCYPFDFERLWLELRLPLEYRDKPLAVRKSMVCYQLILQRWQEPMETGIERYFREHPEAV